MSAEVTPHLAPNESKDSKHETAWWRTKRAKNSLGVALVIAVIGLVTWWFFFHPYVSTDDARVAATFVRAAPDAMGGRVINITVKEGDHVKKGDVLIELDHRNAEAQLTRAKAKATLAQEDLHRIAELVSQKAMPAKDLDLAKTNAETTQAELHLAEVALENTSIRSSIDGVIVQKVVEVGNVVEPGQTLVTICDIDHAWIEANIEETSVGGVKAGQPVSVSVDEGGSLTGKVLEVRNSVASKFALIPSDSGAGNFTKVVQRVPIKIEITNSSGRALRAGQSVEIKIKVR
jgi:membrane fusion protein, multidrug efflux system